MFKTPTRHQAVDFLVLVLRWYLAYYMFTYGLSKLTDGQFHIKPEMLDQPLKDINRFYLAWYVLSLSKVFNVVIGSFQIIGALLIVINRTALVGTLFLLPILVQILLTDIAFTTEVLGLSLIFRLSFMILSALFILWYYRERMVNAWKVLTDRLSPRFQYPWWLYMLLPALGFLMDFVFSAVSIPLKYIVNVLLRSGV